MKNSDSPIFFDATNRCDIAVYFDSCIKMIKSPFTSVSIPDVSVHNAMFHLFQSNADKKALVSRSC